MLCWYKYTDSSWSYFIFV